MPLPPTPPPPRRPSRPISRLGGRAPPPARDREEGEGQDVATPPPWGPAPTLEMFEIVRSLGRGSRGEVLEVRRRSDGRRFALKRSLRPLSGPAQRRHWLRECHAQRGAGPGPGLLPLLAAWEQRGHFHLLTPLCPAGSLGQLWRRGASRGGVASALGGVASALGGVASFLRGVASWLGREMGKRGVASSLRGVASVFRGVALPLRGVATFLMGVASGLRPEMAKRGVARHSSDASSLANRKGGVAEQNVGVAKPNMGNTAFSDPVATSAPSLATPDPLATSTPSVATPGPSLAIPDPVATSNPSLATPDPVATSTPPVATSSPSVATPGPSVAIPDPVATSTRPVATSSPSLATPDPVATSSPSLATPDPLATSSPSVATPVPSVTTSSPSVATPAPSVATPDPVATFPPSLATPDPVATSIPPVATSNPSLATPDPVATSIPPVATSNPSLATPDPVATSTPSVATPEPVATSTPSVATPEPVATSTPSLATPDPPAGRPLAEWRLRGYLWDVLLALRQLHARPLAHGDLKPDNVLLDPWGRCRLADFGLATPPGWEGGGAAGGGDPRYVAPEGLVGEGRPPGDIFSLALTVAELAGERRLPGEGEGWRRLRRGGGGRLPPGLGEGLSPELRALLAAMLDPDPRLRPSAAELLRGEGLRGAGRWRPLTRLADAGLRRLEDWLEAVPALCSRFLGSFWGPRTPPRPPRADPWRLRGEEEEEEEEGAPERGEGSRSPSPTPDPRRTLTFEDEDDDPEPLPPP